MSSKKVIISIVGPMGSGKTLLTQAIYALLKRHGMHNIHVSDEGDASMPSRHADPDDYIRAIPKDAKITIKNRVGEP